MIKERRQFLFILSLSPIQTGGAGINPKRNNLAFCILTTSYVHARIDWGNIVNQR